MKRIKFFIIFLVFFTIFFVNNFAYSSSNTLIYKDGKLRFFIDGNEAGSVNENLNNNWNHVVINVEKDGTKNLSKMYLNGRLVSTDNSINYTDSFSSNLTFGSLDSGTGFNFNGLLDEVAIYNRPLLEKEVLQNYSNSVFSYNNLGKYPISGLENNVLNSRYIQWRDNIIARENINSSISLTPILSEVEIIGETKGGGALKSHTITPDTNLSNWGKIIVQTSDLYDNLVGYWNFDSLNINGSDFEVLDNSLNNNVGEVNGASFRDSGKINGALEFDGVNDYIEIPYDETLDFKESDKITLSAWIYPEAGAATWYSVISKGIAQQYAVTFNSENRYLHFENHDLGSALNTSELELGFNRWQHVVAVYDGEKKEIFINGQKKAEALATGFMSSNLESLFIGMDGNDEYFKGMIDEVRIYNSSLSERQIADLYYEKNNIIKYQILDQNGKLIPDSDMPGNELGLIPESGVIDISGLSVLEYPMIQIKAIFDGNDNYPTLDKFVVTWDELEEDGFEYPSYDLDNENTARMITSYRIELIDIADINVSFDGIMEIAEDYTPLTEVKAGQEFAVRMIAVDDENNEVVLESGEQFLNFITNATSNSVVAGYEKPEDDIYEFIEGIVVASGFKFFNSKDNPYIKVENDDTGAFGISSDIEVRHADEVGSISKDLVLTGYSKRQMIKIANSYGGELTNQSIRVEIPYNSSMQKDFEDINFTLSDGLTEIPFRLERKIDAGNKSPLSKAIFWVNIPRISDNATYIYMYYGNSSMGGVENGLVGSWSLDEGSKTTVYDPSYYYNTGNISGATWRLNNNCVSGACLEFDGVNDYVEIGTLGNANFIDGITVASWFSVSDKGKNQKIISNTEDANFQLGLNHTDVPNALSFLLRLGTKYENVSIPISLISEDKWYYVLAKYDGKIISIYLNGILQDSLSCEDGDFVCDTPISFNSAVPLCIGSEADISGCQVGYYFDGKLDEVRLWNRGLSEEEIMREYKR